MNVGVCRVRKCRGKDVVHGCSNIADLNTGVSLHSRPVLKENARHFVGDFATSALNTLSALLWASIVDTWI